MRPCNDSKIAITGTPYKGMGGGGDQHQIPPFVYQVCLRKNKRDQWVTSVNSMKCYEFTKGDLNNAQMR